MAFVPVVRLPGTWKTSVQPSSMGNSQYRSAVSGTPSTQGSLDTSTQATVYSVSAFGAVMSRNEASGYARTRANWPIGARVPSGAGTLVITRRVISMVTRG